MHLLQEDFLSRDFKAMHNLILTNNKGHLRSSSSSSNKAELNHL
jgi:hypothetical protein